MSYLALKLISENIENKGSYLDLTHCDLFSLPKEISNCIWLEALFLQDNPELADLSPLEKLTNLKILYVSKTKVSDLTPLMAHNDLIRLDISNTEVADLSCIKGLFNLQMLYAFKSKVFDLSPLKFLENLQVVDISETLVSDILPLLPLIKKGRQVRWSTHLGDIRVNGCPLTTPPPEIVQQGNEACLRYFEQLEQEGTAQIYEAKLLLIGEGGSGKTTLCRKLFNLEAPLPNERETTYGVDIQPLFF